MAICDGCSMVMWFEIRRATTQKEEQAQNKPLALVRHPARGLNLDRHTLREAQYAPWIGARGSNADPGLVVPGGAPLGHSDNGSSDFVSMYAIVRVRSGRTYTGIAQLLF